MKPVAIKDDIYWVGTIDWQRRDFHGYSLAPKGTTYNAYLVKDRKTTLFDTVPATDAEELLCNIAAVLGDVESVDYIVANHGEMDHSGALPELVRRVKPEKVFCSPMAAKSLAGHFDVSGWPLTVVDTKNPLSLGKREVRFVETRMIHWPDSMVSYIPQDKLLISQDAFGQNIACAKRFADEVDEPLMRRQAARYYANIVLPYSAMTLKALEGIEKMGIEIDTIAPDHGLVFRGADCAKVLSWYKEFALQKPRNKAVVFYDTMWKSTKAMAEAVAEGLDESCAEVKVMSLKVNHHSDVMEEVFDAGAILVGSPTHNNGILPLVSAMLTYMKGLRPLNKIGAAFGSYGWSGESTKIITEALESMGFETVEGVKCQFVPKPDTLSACVELGRKVGLALKAKVGG